MTYKGCTKILFIETPIFTEDVKELLTDDENSKFQQFMADNPDWGDAVPHTGGAGLPKVKVNAAVFG